MRLTTILMHLKKKPPPGIKYRGKNRVVPEPKMKDLNRLRIDFERTERNMLILRHPYLTPEQSFCSIKSFREPFNFVEHTNKARNKRFNRHFTWSDQLCHLRTTDGWE